MKPLRAADIRSMRKHCTQCLAEVFANGRQAPTGEMLCGPCYGALWGPKASEELRSLVRLHTGRRTPIGSISVAR